jgi:hypothetical protein
MFSRKIRHGTTRLAVGAAAKKTATVYKGGAAVGSVCVLSRTCTSEAGLKDFSTVSPATSVLLFAPALTREQDRRACS